MGLANDNALEVKALFPGESDRIEEHNAEDEDPPYVQLIWRRTSKWGYEEMLVLNIHTDMVEWFLLKPPKGKKKPIETNGEFVFAAIECADYVHKFHIDEDLE